MNQLKLTDVINPQSQKIAGKGQKHIIVNSLRRNIITDTKQKNKLQQFKLNSHNFSSHDMHRLFMHIYSKEQMSLSDRNLVRRLLLIIFPQSLIYAGGKTLIYNIRYIYFQKNQNIINQRQFFLVLKGVVQIISPYYRKQCKAGMYFGHLQLLGDQQTQNIQIICSTKCSLLVVQQSAFNDLLRHFFQKQIQDKSKCIPPIVRKQLTKFEQFHLYQEMNKVSFPLGTKICSKGQNLQNLIFISTGKANFQLSTSKYQQIYGRVIGLLQSIKEKQTYDQNYIALQQIIGFQIPLITYKKIVFSQRYCQLYSQINKDLSLKQNSDIKNKQEKKKVQSNKNFLRFRKVKLPFKGRLKTSTSILEPSSGLQTESSTSFIFIKSSDNKIKLQKELSYIMDKNSQIQIKHKKIFKCFN